MARFGFCAASSLIWEGWGFAVPFYSVQDWSSLRLSQFSKFLKREFQKSQGLLYVVPLSHTLFRTLHPFYCCKCCHSNFLDFVKPWNSSVSPLGPSKDQNDLNEQNPYSFRAKPPHIGNYREKYRESSPPPSLPSLAFRITHSALPHLHVSLERIHRALFFPSMPIPQFFLTLAINGFRYKQHCDMFLNDTMALSL